MLTVDGQQWSDGFEVVGNKIVFTRVPPKDAMLEISYRYDPTPMFDSFKLRESIIEESLVVMVNQEEIDQQEYRYDSATQEVHFNTQPPSEATIDFRFKKDTPLTRVYTYDAGADRIEVALNGSPESDFEYDPKSGKIEFDQEPPEAATIEIKGFFSKPIFSYPVSVHEDDAVNTSFYDEDTLDPISAMLVDQDLHVAEPDFSEGRRVSVAYWILAKLSMRLYSLQILIRISFRSRLLANHAKIMNTMDQR